MKRLVMGFVVTAFLVSIGIIAAVVVLLDEDRVENNVLTADSVESIDISVLPTSAAWTNLQLQPGDIMEAEIVLTNNSPELAYFTWEVENSNTLLTDAVSLFVGSAGSCSGAWPFHNSDGSMVYADGDQYNGPLTAAANTTPFDIPIGDSRALCFSLVLPSGVDFLPLAEQTDTSVVIFESSQ